MAAPAINNTTPSAASPVLAANGSFTSAWYRFFAALIGPAAEATPLTPDGSPYAFTASQRGFFQVSGGTVSKITLTRGRTVYPVAISAQFVPVSQSDVVTITYSAAPTVVFFPS